MPNLKKFCHSLHHEMVNHLFPFLKSISKLALRLFDLILFISRLRLVYWSTLKIANDLPIFASYYAFVISLTWLAHFLSRDYLLYTRFFIYFLFLSDEGPMLETLDHTIRAGSTPTFLYFDLYLYSAYAAHYVYIYI